MHKFSVDLTKKVTTIMCENTIRSDKILSPFFPNGKRTLLLWRVEREGKKKRIRILVHLWV